MYPTNPHLAYPFAFGATGAAVLDGGTAAEILACVALICDCPQGAQTSNPDFGVPETLFAQAPLNTATFVAAIRRWEPRANLQATEYADADGDVQERHLQLQLITGSNS